MPNLTVNLGMRYSYFGPLSSKQNNLNVVELGTGASALTGLSPRRGGSLYQAQKATSARSSASPGARSPSTAKWSAAAALA